MPTKTKNSTATKKRSAKTAVPSKSTRVPSNPNVDKRAESYATKTYPDNLFTVRNGIPILSDAEREQRITAIRGQQNAVLVAQANHKLDRELQVSEGLSIATQIQAAKNLVQNEVLNREAIALEIEQTKTNIEVEKLNGWDIKLQLEQTRNQIDQAHLAYANIDLQGEQNSLDYRQELWDIKLSNLQLDVQAARQVLNTKIEQLGQRLSGGV